jgi:outer membrane receptor protein involved in Fe transport
MLNKYFLIIIILLQGTANYAQDTINKFVKVVTSYTPEVADANKIYFQPEIKDTASYLPTLSYQIIAKQINVDFETEPLKAAKMVGEPLKDIKGKYLKIGFGNYITPLAQFYINNLRSKEYSFGASIDHLSSHGKIRLGNNKLVDGGYFKDKLSLYGKKMMDKSVLSNEISVNGFGYKLYGFDYIAKPDTTLDKKLNRRQFLNVNYNSEFKSTHKDSAHLNYSILFNYSYFTDNKQNAENYFAAEVNLNKYHISEMVGVDLDFKYFDRSMHLDTANFYSFNINPWVGKFGVRWQVKIGIKFNYSGKEDKGEMFYYPFALMQYNIINNYLVPYIGVDGGQKINHLKNIAFINPFYAESPKLVNSNEKVRIYGGFKGNISSMTSFNFRVSYSVIDSLLMFVNSKTTLANTFDLVYDNSEVLNFLGEFETKPIENFMLGVKGNYYKYKLTLFDKAWNYPDFDVSTVIKYIFRKKIEFGIDFFILGTRYAKDNITTVSYKTFKPVYDLNLSANYYFSKDFTIFLNFNNILNQKYDIWYLYPAQRLNFMAGITYAF